MRKFALAVFIALLIPAAAFASEVRQMPYAYQFEFVNSPVRPAFLICDKCPAGKALVRAPRPVPLVIRMSAPQARFEPLKPTPAKPVPALPVPAKPVPDQPVKQAGMAVHFAFDSYGLRPSAEARLKAAPSLFNGPVAIVGYTDDIGTEAYNMKLSLKRAGAVADYLKRLGVVPATVVGKGECCSVSGIKKLNRRVEIKEVGK